MIAVAIGKSLGFENQDPVVHGLGLCVVCGVLAHTEPPELLNVSSSIIMCVVSQVF